MLRWTFTRGAAAITCELAANGLGGYYICVVPHWNVAAAAVEQHDAVLPALRRHADLARLLREDGWTLARRGSAHLRAA